MKQCPTCNRFSYSFDPPHKCPPTYLVNYHDECEISNGKIDPHDCHSKIYADNAESAAINFASSDWDDYVEEYDLVVILESDATDENAWPIEKCKRFSIQVQLEPQYYGEEVGFETAS